MKRGASNAGLPAGLNVRGLPAAALFGALGALAAVAVRSGFRALQWCFTRSWDVLPKAAANMGAWHRALTPALGAICAAGIIAWFRRRARRHGHEPPPYVEYMEAAQEPHTAIPILPNLWRTLSSAFSVATGASIGREGSMIQFAAACVSFSSRFKRVRVPLSNPLIIACGVAGGVSAAYHAPVAAGFFAIEIALGEWTTAALLPLALASAASWIIDRALEKPGALYPVAPVNALHVTGVAQALLLAALLGLVGVLYQRWLHLFRLLRKLPLALVWAGAAVGLLSIADPRVWGNGDAGLAAALGMNWMPGWSIAALPLLGLLGLRLLATGIATGAGTVGGVFTPTLFIGASLGMLSAAALGRVHVGADPLLLALVGMGALIAAATHAPLMATAMAAELTGGWRLLPLFLCANLLASAIARRLSADSLYAIASQAPLHRGDTSRHGARM